MKKKLLGLLTFVALLVCMSMTVCAAGLDVNFATAASAKVADRNTVVYTATLPSVPASDNGIIYLYELQPAQYSIPAGAAAVGQVPASQNPTFTLPLNFQTNETKLYSKFALAVSVGGVPTMIAQPQYITNPEVLAQYTQERKHPTKKMTQGKEFVNVFMKGTPTYSYYGPRVGQIMNTGENQAITNPTSRNGVADARPTRHDGYYMLNSTDRAAVLALAGEISYYAQHGTIDDWIVGNEVNVRSWNWAAWEGWDDYLRKYEQEFRVMYNAIKSTNANARVYVCIDQNWDRNRAGDIYTYMDAKDFLVQFNADIAREGNIDWDISQHPWSVPLTYAKIWDMSGCPIGAYASKQVATGAMISYQNLGVMTSFLSSPEMVSPKTGQCRNLLLSEIGITNAQGDTVQAAAVFASFMAACRNPYVNGIIYINMPLEPGLDTTLGPKALEVFTHMDENPDAYDAWAKSVIGISDWSQLLR